LSNIYTFVHDTSEPHCRHFDNQSQIDQNLEQDNLIEFIKKYTYKNQEATLQHQIQKKKEGFVWKITKTLQAEKLSNYRFGITIPLKQIEIKDNNEHILTPLINYQQQWQSKYPDQTNIDLPILQVNSFVICIPITENVQFFQFEENDSKYLKIATKYGSDLTLTIHIIPNDNCDLKQMYCNVFPDSKEYAYQAELLKRKIHHKYDIRVLSHEIFHQSECVVYPPNSEELELYMKLLEENLSFYPSTFFEHINLKTISICGYMVRDLELIKGVSGSNGILLNASSKLRHDLQCRAIHHEIFHMVEKKALQNNHEKLWNKLPKNDSFIEHFKDINNIANPSEYRCELFAIFIVDPQFIRQLAETDKTLLHKLNVIQSIFGEISPECNQIIQNHDRDKENDLVRFYEPKCNPNNSVPILDRLLVGVKHSCLTKMVSVLGITQNILIVQNESQVPKNVDLAYVTINPLDFCAIEYIEHNIQVAESFNQWISIHNNLEKRKTVLRLKSEDVLRFNTHIVENFFRGVKEHLNVNNLWDIDGKIRPYNLDSIPFLKKNWDLFRNASVIIRVGYSNVSYEE